MSDENNKPLEFDALQISPDNEKSELYERIKEIQVDIKKRRGCFPVNFDEKTFMDEGWEC